MTGAADQVGDAIARNDLDELIRIVDALADAAKWDDVVSLRDRARRAFDDTGRQLWPAASWAEYRVALHGPDDLLDEVLTPGAGVFAPGPLTEVAAQHHTWEHVATHLPEGPTAALFAHECVARGEVIDGPVVASEVLSVPLARASFEPDYLVATYTLAGVDVEGPETPRGRLLDPATTAVEALADDETLEVLEAFRVVVAAWSAQSAARIRAVGVDGDARAAISCLGASREARIAPLSPQEALLRLAWAGASSGSCGPRRGLAAGRDSAWHAAGAIAGFDPHDTIDPDEFGEALNELRWYWWGDHDVQHDRVLRLAVDDPIDGVAFAISAVDRGA
jgi:hypothetical protein